ncbi:DegV family protein [Arthrobacter jiangjiafuii]|uniref:DegV family protein n=1 Tax=Arthrobacter jiangjiafuii TaxID=2817475 RepID=A0A975QZV3_9MICC|nr:DegV family protein [Arthrobacter jiangjiafuii]MBP3043340.1 DegV family protein [Arthrobacter jiangjiafuii]QWC08883.1 DegV family protein [Arthrobacter jiangjiafuii]
MNVDWRQKLAARAKRGRGRNPGAASAPRVGVVTDSTAALPDGWAESAAVTDLVRVVPMPVMIGDQIYGEGTDRMIGALALALAQGSEVRTSRPSPGKFEAAYAELAAAGCSAIISLHLSAHLSGTVDSARLAARTAPVPVTVIDTASVAMGLGFAVAAAAEEARDGGSATSVEAAARAATASSTLLFYVPSLEQLRRGGRIGAAAGWLGTLFAVKPILVVREGKVVPLERVRSAPRALARLTELVQQEIAARSGRVRVAVHHFGNEAEAERLAGAIAGDAPDAELMICSLPAVLAAHAGLGVLAVAVVGTVTDPAALPAGPVPPDAAGTSSGTTTGTPPVTQPETRA